MKVQNESDRMIKIQIEKIDSVVEKTETPNFIAEQKLALKAKNKPKIRINFNNTLY